MVHRRTLTDDQRGVGEPLNETACACAGTSACEAPCDEGLVVRGTHLLALAPRQASARTFRALQQRLNAPLELAFGTVRIQPEKKVQPEKTFEEGAEEGAEERAKEGAKEGLYRLSADAREPQNLTKPEEYQTEEGAEEGASGGEGADGSGGERDGPVTGEPAGTYLPGDQSQGSGGDSEEVGAEAVRAWAKAFTLSLSLVAAPLPASVHLLTLQSLSEATALVRLAHLYEVE
eukprot:692627-Prorocentrum_minimum.AAC.1